MDVPVQYSIAMRFIFPFFSDGSEVGFTMQDQHHFDCFTSYTLGSANMAGWNGWTRIESMYGPY